MKRAHPLALIGLVLLLVSCEDASFTPEPDVGNVSEGDTGEFLLATLEVADGTVEVKGRSLLWDAKREVASFDVFLVNVGRTLVAAPALLVVTGITPAEVEFKNPDGLTDDQLPYKRFDDEFGDDHALRPGERSGEQTFEFGVQSYRSFRTTFRIDLTTGGRISGIVFDDDNENGIQDDSETGVAELTVTLTFAENVGGGEMVATTGGDGEYSFSDLPMGFYSVEVDVPPGATATTPNPSMFTLLEQEDGTIASYDGAHFGVSVPPRITCAEGQWIVFRLDEQDDFTGPPVPTNPSDELAAFINAYWGRPIIGLDEVRGDGIIAHTFTDLPDGICAAELTLRTFSLVSGSNDTFRLEFLGPDPLPQGQWGYRPTFSFLFGSWSYGTQTLVFDLGNLEPHWNHNSVLHLMADGALDVVIEDDTAVDFMVLKVCVDCVEAAPSGWGQVRTLHR